MSEIQIWNVRLTFGRSIGCPAHDGHARSRTSCSKTRRLHGQTLLLNSSKASLGNRNHLGSVISIVLLTTLVLLKTGMGPTCTAWRFIAYVVDVQVWLERLSVKALMLTPSSRTASSSLTIPHTSVSSYGACYTWVDARHDRNSNM